MNINENQRLIIITKGIPGDSGITDAPVTGITYGRKSGEWVPVATQDDIPTKISELDNDVDYLETETDPTVPSWAKTPEKPSYTKSDVGLSEVDNTSDINKPVSIATSEQLALKAPLAPKITVGLTAEADTDILRPHPLTAATTFPSPTGTPMDGFGFVIELQDDGTARALTWGSDYADGFAALPTTTTAGKLGQIAVQYRSGKYRCDGVRWMA